LGVYVIRSELVDRVARVHPYLTRPEADAIVSAVFDAIVNALADGRRVELRGFGAFTARPRLGRTGRNPRTGGAVVVPPKRVPHFRAGKEMRVRLNVEAAAE